MKRSYRIISACFVLLFMISAVMTGTLAWHTDQTAKNEAAGDKNVIDVELIKLAKDVYGNLTEIPLPGAVFLLFQKGDVSDTQVGSSYVTDAEGKIHVALKPGSYYFVEQYPPEGYDFDLGADAVPLKEYHFTVPEIDQAQDDIRVVVYNRPLTGPLTITKTVQTIDAAPLTPAQQAQEFTFVVTFADGGTYEYSIDGGPPQSLTSGDTIILKHGQSAVFDKLPVGLKYTVGEMPVQGYVVQSNGHTGNITQAGCLAEFVNTYDDATGGFTITKEVRDLSVDNSADPDQEFEFRVTFSDAKSHWYYITGGTLQELPSGGTIKLKHGQSATFVGIPAGVQYVVKEIRQDKYMPLTDAYTGVIATGQYVELPFVNVYDNPETDPGSLRIQKQVVGDYINTQYEFTFRVTFADGGTYTYTVDGGEPQTLVSGGTIKLKHGQSALFTDLPPGLGYTVEELKADSESFIPLLDKAEGEISAKQESFVLFQNLFPNKMVEIHVRKLLAGDYPVEDLQKEFTMTIDIDGVPTTFVLKPGETKVFEVPAGAQYSVTEEDYSKDGYSQSITNGSGTAVDAVTQVDVVNYYVGKPTVDVGGEKTWSLGDYGPEVLPDSITVQLKIGNVLIEEKVVTPDAQGDWLYTFTAPKYDADGQEIVYHIEEAPLLSFIPTYDEQGYDIKNTYLPPAVIDPPLVEKTVQGENAPKAPFQFLMMGQDGAPMPDGAIGNSKIVTLEGPGQVEFGQIAFPEPGSYTYTIHELNSGVEGWTYDDASYVLTVDVVMQDGALQATHTLTRYGAVTDVARFTNSYVKPPEPETVTIRGVKTWVHGDNPEENRPSAITVFVYIDGKVVAQQQVTAENGWQYIFELPRHDVMGREIVYTIGEAEVPGYTMSVQGYDLVNTYTPDEPEDPTPEDPTPEDPTPPSQEIPTPTPPDAPSKPETGDDSNAALWIVLLIMSMTGMLACVLIKRKDRPKPLRAKRR